MIATGPDPLHVTLRDPPSVVGASQQIVINAGNQALRASQQAPFDVLRLHVVGGGCRIACYRYNHIGDVVRGCIDVGHAPTEKLDDLVAAP
jgi:hypothetical protein